jgi:hypothetical protein
LQCAATLFLAGYRSIDVRYPENSTELYEARRGIQAAVRRAADLLKKTYSRRAARARRLADCKVG